ncbi:MAG: TonB family protein [Sulfitobacter sp.]|nr:TonB family protein [Sulfitobacter sp.]
MSRVVEFVAFLGVAAALHGGLWVGFAPPGQESEGAGGEAIVSLAASNGAMTELVADWTRPIDVLQQVPDVSPPLEATETLPRVAPARTDTTPARSAAPDPVAVAKAENLPLVESASPRSVVTARLADSLPQMPAAPQPAGGSQSPQLSPPTPMEAPRMAALPEALRAAPTETLPQVDGESARSPILDRAPQASHRPEARPQPRPAAKAQAPREPQKPAARAQSAQKAAGGNGGKSAGQKPVPQQASLSKAQRNSLMAGWGAAIRNQVERRKRYPAGTRASGTTVLRISVARTGRLAGVSIVRSSGDRLLDQAAVRAVQRARYPAAPKGLTSAQYPFNLPIAFRAK